MHLLELLNSKYYGIHQLPQEIENFVSQPEAHLYAFILSHNSCLPLKQTTMLTFMMITYFESAVIFFHVSFQRIWLCTYEVKRHLTDLLALMRSVGWTLVLQLFSDFINHPFLLPYWIIRSLVFPILTTTTNPSLYLIFSSSCYHMFLLPCNKTPLKELTLWPNINSAHVIWNPSVPLTDNCSCW